VPFLDYRRVPMVRSLPDAYKIRYFKTKRLLKQMATELLPAEIIHRKKRGFTVPISGWLRQSGLLREFIQNRAYYEHGFVRYDHVCQLLTEHLNRQKDHARRLWLIFVFNTWWHKVHCGQM
jgi:asparagine synthase (glutamine-hydrolysing)